MRSNNQVLQWQNLMVSEFSIRMTHDKVSKKTDFLSEKCCHFNWQV